MRNMKLGITMYIIAVVFVVFCFWIVGCSTDDCEETELTSPGGYKSDNCVITITQDSTDTEEIKTNE